MDLGIAGRVAGVTGADSGIGFATARFLASEGVKVVLTDQYEAQLAASLNTPSVWHFTKDSIMLKIAQGSFEVNLQPLGLEGTSADWKPAGSRSTRRGMATCKPLRSVRC